MLDLNGDGVRLVNLNQSKAYFDLTGNGFATHTSWLDKEDGFLVLDANGDGKVNNINELFGNLQQTGYEELATLDVNGDGVIDTNDAAFAALKVWQDKNGDGVTQTGELRTLQQVGIASINLAYQDVAAQADSDGQIARQGSFTWANGTEGIVAETSGIAADVLFASNPTLTRFVGEVQIDPAVLAVGNIKGYGQLPDLHIAMSLNAEFKETVLNLFANANIDTLLANFETLLTQWAGVENIAIETIDSDHRLNLNSNTGKVDFELAGESFTLEQLGIIKQYAGLDVLKLGDGQWRENGEIVTTGGYYRQAYDELSRNLLVKFAVANGLLAEIAPDLSYNPNTDLLSTHSAIDARTFEAALTAIAENLADTNHVAKQWLLITALTEIAPATRETLSDAIYQLLSGASNLNALLPAFENPLFQRLDLNLHFSYGTEGNETLHGSANHDVISGFAGDDALYGGDGDDLLIGGEGNDYLDGGYGNDTYIFHRGDGQDSLYDYDWTASNKDIIQFGEGITPDEVRATRSGDSLILNLKDSADQIVVNYHFCDEYAIEEIHFADGTVWEKAYINDVLVIQSTDNDDALYANDNVHTLSGGLGNDTLYGNGDDNTLYGDEGDDALVGDAGNDLLDGGEGNDTLYGGDEDDVLSGGEGDDALYGEAGDDLLIGGEGNDYLDGGYGNDTYIFNRGDGQDTLYDYDWTAANKDILQFGEGIAPDEVRATRSGDSLILNLKDSADQIVVNYHFCDEYAIEEIHFADGTVWDKSYINDTLVIQNTDGDDALYANDNVHTLSGGLGNDTLYGNGDDNTLYGDEGDDALVGDAGNDLLDGGEGNDTLYGGDEDDVLSGGEGDDALYGEAGDDHLIGGTGNDYLDGGYGNDTYIFNRGDGQDSLYDYDWTASNKDILQFGEGIAPDEVRATRSGDSLVLNLKDSADQVVVNYHFYDEYAIEEIHFADGTVWEKAYINDVLVIQSTDGDDALYANDNVHTLSGGLGNDTLYGNGDDNTLYGNEGNDTLHGGSGHNTLNGGEGDDGLYGGDEDDVLSGGEGHDGLYGGDGDDLLIGGTGNDYLDGGYGNDTYIFNRGDGQDTLCDYDWTTNNKDIIQFGEGIAPDEVRATRSGDSLILNLKDSADQIVVNYHFCDEYAIEEIHFADGTVWDKSYINNTLVTQSTDGDDALYANDAVHTLSGGLGNDTLYGNGDDNTLYGDEGNDTLHGGGGHNTLDGGEGDDGLYGGDEDDVLSGGEGHDGLYGGDGDDLLIGGEGNDYLDGGYGNDTYIFNRGDGQDTLCDYDWTASNKDIIQFGEGIAPDEVRATRSGDSLVLNLKDSADQIVVNYHFYDEARSEYAIEEIHFADGTVWDKSYINNTLVTQSTDGDDALYANDNVHTLSGGLGNDTLYGNGDDNTLYGDEGNDTLYGGGGHNTLDGGEGDDGLYGGNEDDVLSGDEGHDGLYGGDGDDLLIGGTGNDYLDGGYGNDTYIFNRGDGQDTLYDYDWTASNKDILQFGEDITPDEVRATRSGDSLILNLKDSTDQIVVNYHFCDEYAIEEIHFADGTVWDKSYINNTLVTQSTDDDDALYANDAVHTLSGGLGNDTLFGSNSDDTLYGNEGNDTLHGGGGHNTLDGGEGDDGLYGGDEDDVLSGGEGNDGLYGGDGDDLLIGGTGNDYLDGGYGNDTYIFHRGDGQDTLYDYDWTANNKDIIQFGEGIAPDEVRATRSGDSLVLNLKDSTDQIVVNYHFCDEYAIEEIHFADGTVWDKSYINDTLVIQNTDGDDALYANDNVHTLSGGLGNDTLYGNGDDNTLYGDEGDDALVGDAGNDLLDGGEGNDTLYGGDEDDVLSGGEGDDALYGEAGDDLLIGGEGNDYLDGGYGNDTYILNRGDGQDTLYDYDTLAGNHDILQFGTDIAAEDLWFTRQDDNLTVQILHSQDTVSVSNWFSDIAYQIEAFKLSDGSVLHNQQVQTLIDAMANQTPASIGDAELPEDLIQIIGSTWALPEAAF
ncbi:hypothetical protein AGMMS50289_04600 [Betaproteobacteria bacterium]|nr:hypothetical protein AGMMS50289_04600 [Betaproteobacteria bacterium]